MFVVKPNPPVRLAAKSASVGLYLPIITSWHEGLGLCSVIQNQSAVWKAITELFATISGFLRPSNPKARPAGP